MVGALKRWLKKWLGLDIVEVENLRLARAILALDKLIHDDWKIERANPEQVEDHEARIAFCESRLTPKPSEAKIVPRPHKTTFRQFAEAASKATEEEIPQ